MKRNAQQARLFSSPDECEIEREVVAACEAMVIELQSTSLTEDRQRELEYMLLMLAAPGFWRLHSGARIAVVNAYPNPQMPEEYVVEYVDLLTGETNLMPIFGVHGLRCALYTDGYTGPRYKWLSCPTDEREFKRLIALEIRR